MFTSRESKVRVSSVVDDSMNDCLSLYTEGHKVIGGCILLDEEGAVARAVWKRRKRERKL